MAEHMPLLVGDWNDEKTEAFLAAKEAYWQQDDLGHWAILIDGQYAGWGGFQLEGDEWDFGLVLRRHFFGAGLAISARALEFARSNPAIPSVTFLLPLSRRNLGALQKAGAKEIGLVDYAGVQFRKFRLETKKGGPSGPPQLNS